MACWCKEHEGYDPCSDSSCYRVTVPLLTFAGPYTVAKVNDDGTYDLDDERGMLFKYKVKEKDLKPL
jgi:hypothetical protein